MASTKGKDKDPSSPLLSSTPPLTPIGPTAPSPYGSVAPSPYGSITPSPYGSTPLPVGFSPSSSSAVSCSSLISSSTPPPIPDFLTNSGAVFVHRIKYGSAESDGQTFCFSLQDTPESIDKVIRNSLHIRPQTRYELYIQNNLNEQERITITPASLLQKLTSDDYSIYIREDCTSPRRQVLGSNFLFLQRNREPRRYKIKKLIYYHTQPHNRPLAKERTQIPATELEKDFSIMAINMQISAELKTIATYPEELLVFELNIVPTFGVTSSDGPSPKFHSKQWFMSSFRLRVAGKVIQNQEVHEMVEYGHFPSNENQAIQVQRTTGWTGTLGAQVQAIPTNSNISADLSYTSSLSRTETINDFSTTFLRVPLSTVNFVEWQVELAHFNRGKEPFVFSKDESRKAKEIPKAAMSLLQKEFIRSWTIRKKPNSMKTHSGDKVKLRFRVTATVLAHYGPDPGKGDQVESYFWVSTNKQQGAQTKGKYIREAGPIGEQKRVGLSQHRVIECDVDLKHKRILTMEISMPIKAESGKLNYFANNFGDDLNIVYTMPEETAP